MNRLALLLALTFALSSCASWPGRPYSEVRAYAYNLKGRGPLPIIENGMLSKTATSRTGVVLTPQQVQRLIAALTGSHPSHPHAMCFTPRHAFVFYDAAQTPRAWVEICFQCLNNRSEPSGISTHADFPALAELCAELRLPASPGRGFRKGFDEFRLMLERPKPAEDRKTPGLKPSSRQ